MKTEKERQTDKKITKVRQIKDYRDRQRKKNRKRKTEKEKCRKENGNNKTKRGLADGERKM